MLLKKYIQSLLSTRTTREEAIEANTVVSTELSRTSTVGMIVAPCNGYVNLCAHAQKEGWGDIDYNDMQIKLFAPVGSNLAGILPIKKGEQLNFSASKLNTWSVRFFKLTGGGKRLIASLFPKAQMAGGLI